MGKIMNNPFEKDISPGRTDETLVKEALKGNKKSLEDLIRRHQAWIYNIALRMVWHPEDAEDVTQEVLIKVITKLSTFKGYSSFRTWMYRITANHVINMKKRSTEKKVVSFNKYWKGIENTPDLDLPDKDSLPVDYPVILEEIKIHCMTAMLLCLDRGHRLAFILGEIFSLRDTVGSEIMNISRDNFRQKLSRARRKVYNFIQEKCGVVNDRNPCHCSRKAKALLDNKAVDPENLIFNTNYINKVKSFVTQRSNRLNNLLDRECRNLFWDQPFREDIDMVKSFRKLIENGEFREIFNF
jgi:RNA polymerase sigma factor (sigma-70 family)